MNRILGTITNLDQHFNEIANGGEAYRAATLQGVCARFGIHLIFCRPYAPEK